MNTNARILVVDDEDRIRRLIRMYLEREEFDIEEAANGSDALELALTNDYDLILLDIMMPEMDGYEVCTELRKEKTTPVIMLTARGEEMNRVEGFEAGADDYVVKPFSPREVVYRVKALLRRSSKTAYLKTDQTVSNAIVFPDLMIDDDAHRVIAGEEEVNLTPKEYELLHYFAQSPEKVSSRANLLKNVWHYDFFGDLRTVDTHVKRLREKLNRASPEAAAMIATVWGVGYKLEVPKE